MIYSVALIMTRCRSWKHNLKTRHRIEDIKKAFMEHLHLVLCLHLLD